MKGKEPVIRPQYVREIRAVLAMTQKELADALDVSPRTVWSWENQGAPKGWGYAMAGLLFQRGRMREAADILFSQGEIFRDS